MSALLGKMSIILRLLFSSSSEKSERKVFFATSFFGIPRLNSFRFFFPKLSLFRFVSKVTGFPYSRVSLWFSPFLLLCTHGEICLDLSCIKLSSFPSHLSRERKRSIKRKSAVTPIVRYRHSFLFFLLSRICFRIFIHH